MKINRKQIVGIFLIALTIGGAVHLGMKLDNQVDIEIGNNSKYHAENTAPVSVSNDPIDVPILLSLNNRTVWFHGKVILKTMNDSVDRSDIVGTATVVTVVNEGPMLEKQYAEKIIPMIRLPNGRYEIAFKGEDGQIHITYGINQDSNLITVDETT